MKKRNLFAVVLATLALTVSSVAIAAGNPMVGIWSCWHDSIGEYPAESFAVKAIPMNDGRYLARLLVKNNNDDDNHEKYDGFAYVTIKDDGVVYVESPGVAGGASAMLTRQAVNGGINFVVRGPIISSQDETFGLSSTAMNSILQVDFYCKKFYHIGNSDN